MRDVLTIEERQAIKEDLRAMEGERAVAAVSIYGVERNGFFTQMSVDGVLERHPEEDRYRIVNRHSEKTYTYFQPDDVIVINVLSSPTIIHLAIDQKGDE